MLKYVMNTIASRSLTVIQSQNHSNLFYQKEKKSFIGSQGNVRITEIPKTARRHHSSI